MRITEWLKKNWKWVALGAGVGLAGYGLYQLSKRPAPEEKIDPIVRFGMVTDTHNNESKRADLERQNCIPWLTDFVNEMNEWKPDFIIHLGDLSDAWEAGTQVSVEENANRITTAVNVLKKSVVPCYYVLGNHEIGPPDCTKSWALPLLKDLLPEGVNKFYYSFDVKRFHFICLDAFRYQNEHEEAQSADGFYIYPEEKDWLIHELKTVKKPTVLFIHVPLSGFFEGAGGWAEYYNSMRNGSEIRALLESYEQVIAVFEGHYHNPDGDTVSGGNHYMWRDGKIPYFGLYSLVDQDNLRSWGRVTLNAETRKGVFEGFGDKPKTFEFSW